MLKTHAPSPTSPGSPGYAKKIAIGVTTTVLSTLALRALGKAIGGPRGRAIGTKLGAFLGVTHASSSRFGGIS